MKFTIDWLKDHLKTNKTEAEIIEKLNSTGLEVEKVETLKNELSDFIIATPETRFIEVFVRRGLVVDFGGSWVLPRIIGIQKAKELMMTSNEINGEELNKLGVLYKLTNAENMDTVFKELIEKLNEQSFISICMVKQQIRDGLNLTFEKSIENETVNQNSRFQHQDVVEGMTAFFEKRQPNYKNTLDE